MTILDVVTEERDGISHVRLKGELDLSTVGKVQEELARLDRHDAGTILLDLSRLSFLDSTGLRAVVSAAERARERERRFVVAKGPESVHRVFEITRLEEHLEMVDDPSAVASTG